jgi:hypothetical protein
MPPGSEDCTLGQADWRLRHGMSQMGVRFTARQPKHGTVVRPK